MTQRVHPLTAVVVLAIVLVAIMIGYSRRIAQLPPAPPRKVMGQRQGQPRAAAVRPQAPPQEKRQAAGASTSCSDGGSCAVGGGSCSADGKESCTSGEPKLVRENHSEKLPHPVIGE